jgi:outer membrane protein OmpA-like peptidoglycan-associated protein
VRGKLSARRGSGHASHTASSFTDLMASLLVIFVLLFVATLNAGSGQRKVVQEELIKALQGELKAAGLDERWVDRDGKDKNAVVIVFPDSLLFRVGDANVDERGSRTLHTAVPRLEGVLCSDKFRKSIETVVIEGHTDTTYRGTNDLDVAKAKNLELSQGRSMSVVRESLGSLGEERSRECFRSMLSASGRGQEEPLAGISGADARQRRVIFKIRIQSDLAQALGSTAGASNR